MRLTSVALLAALALAPAALAQNAATPAQQPAKPPQTSQATQQPPAKATEAYRIRITNSQFGAVEISTDTGKSWLLVARVSRPASMTASGGSTRCEVIRSNEYGAALSVGDGQILRVLPESRLAERDPSAILVNVPLTSAFFKDLLPPAGSNVQSLSPGKTEPLDLPASYSPREDDTLLITVRETRLPPEKIGEYARDAATNYRDRAIASVRARGGHPTAGALSVIARLPNGDVPAAVTFLVDGVVAAIMNRPPFAIQWNTREWANGEHLVEARALNSAGVTVSRKRSLVVVDNPK